MSDSENVSPAASPPDRSDHRSGEARRIDHQRLGATVEAEVLRYSDDDFPIHDSSSVDTNYRHGGSIVIEAPTAREFLELVWRSSPHYDPSVKHIPAGRTYNLGQDNRGEEYVLERIGSVEFVFRNENSGDECQLTADQLADLYQFLVGSGYGDIARSTSDGLTRDRVGNWQTGDPCPDCSHPVVYTIVRGGVKFRDDGSYKYEDTLGIHAAWCASPDCEWYNEVDKGGADETDQQTPT